ncbi:MAG: hypothetical protein ACI906_004525 [Candidatus Latescibacterota bacterium]|jgi:uncharacterized protein (DUF342 family)
MMRKRRSATRSRTAKGKNSTPIAEQFIAKDQTQNDVGENPAISAKAERQAFGQTGAAWMDVKISDDNLSATVERITLGGDQSLSSADVLNTLRDQFHITYGIDESLVSDLTQLALASSQRVVVGNYLVACGKPPIPGADGRIIYTFRARLKKGDRLKPRRLRAAFKEPTLAAVLDKSPPGLLVKPGEALARRVASTKGESGRDIFGNDKLLPGVDPPMQAGTNVSESDGFYLAESCGYVCLIDDQLSVLTPLWLSPDKMSAHFLSLQQAAPTVKLHNEWLLELLADLGVTHGIDPERIAALCQSPLAGAENGEFPVAFGTLPVQGEDTRIDFTFDILKRSGKIMPDGSIDLRERNTAIGIEEGQAIGRVVSATVGTEGIGLLGEVIPVEDGQEIFFVAGENVRAEGDPVESFYATKTGNIHLAEQSIHVKEVFHVRGDVDYETGNIDTLKDVQIDGNIRAGFTVKAGGSLSVSGIIESGVTVTARGDIIAAQGIVGEGTKMTAQGALSMGNIQTKFVQNATVMARGNIEVGSYIFNSTVRAGRDLIVRANGGERGGSIVGGESYASQYIRCHIVGSVSASNTIIGIKPGPEMIARLTKLDKVLEGCESDLTRLVRSMGLQAIDTAHIKTALDNLRDSKGKAMAEKVSQLYELIERREQLEAERNKLMAQQSSMLDQSEIHVEKALFAGVQVKIGETAINIVEDTNGQIFTNSLDGTGARSISSNKHT